MNKHFKSCIDVLELLAENPQIWGNHYKDFFYAFKKLSLDEVTELKKVVNPKGTYNLMHQYVRNYIRNYAKLSHDNRISEMNDCIWLMWLDDFSDGDWRDNLLNIVRPFLAVTEEQYVHCVQERIITSLSVLARG